MAEAPKTGAPDTDVASASGDDDLFRILTETASSAIFVLRDRLLYVNPAAATITGYSEEELLALDSWTQIIHPDYRQLLLERAQGRLEGRDEPRRDEIRILCKNGEERWLDYTADAITYHGKPAILGTAFDITERKLFEQALRDSESKHRGITDNIPGCIYQFVLHPDGSYAFPYMSESVSQLGGYSREEYEADATLAFSHLFPQDIDTMQASIARSANELSTWSLEFRIRDRHGQVKWIQGSSTPQVQDNGDIVWNGVMLDITERRLAEQELRDSQERFSRIFHSSPAIICVTTPQEGRFVDINDTFERVFGYTRDEIIGRTARELGIWFDYEDRMKTLNNLLAAGSLRDLEFPFVAKNGETIHLYGSVDLITIEDQLCMLMVAQDMTQRHKAGEERSRREKAMRLHQRSLLELATHTAVNQGELDDAIRVITEKAAWALEAGRVSIWKYEDNNASLVCLDMYDRLRQRHRGAADIRVDERPALFASLREDLTVAISDLTTDELAREYGPNYVADSDVRSQLLAAIRLGGNNIGVLCCEQVNDAREWTLEEQSFVASLSEVAALAFDQQQRRVAETELQREKERAQVTLAAIGDGVVTTDMHGHVEYLNPVAEELTGWSLKKAAGHPLASVLHLVDEVTRKLTPDPVTRCLRRGRGERLANQILLNRKLGTEYAVEIVVSPILDRNRQLVGVTLVAHDVTELRGMARQLSYQATHDGLTGLINRRAFEEHLTQALVDARQQNNQHVMCYVDLDQFKVVNDTCGHIAGDELLQELGSMLQPLMRKHDVIARLGGDEFGILLRHCDIENARQQMATIHDFLGKYRYTWEDKVFEVGASIGMIAINAHSGTLTDVMSAVDSACYVAKDQGRNRVHVFQSDDLAIAKRHGEMEWLQRISRAFEEKRFMLYFQPIEPLSIRAREHGRHCEMLLRMADDAGMPLLPQGFISAAERYHLMPTLDRWVIRSVLMVLQHQDTLRDLSVEMCAVNLSGQSLGDDHFLDFVVEQIDSSGVDPSLLCFEITETAAIANLSRAMRFLSVLKGMGCRFALDDFGKGLSSFSYLKNLPVDYLKIDGGFVRDLAYDPIDYAMVEAINQVGHVMGIQTIAESVENDSTLGLVRELGVDFAQGSFVSRPRPLPVDLHKPPLLDLPV